MKHIFISHAWNKDSNYQNLTKLFDQRKYFTWEDHSVPKGNRIHSTNDNHIYNGIKSKMRASNCVVFIASMDAAYSDWLQEEINIANDLGIPIIGVKPWGATRVPQVVTDAAANKIVGWNTESIVTAIRKYSL